MSDDLQSIAYHEAGHAVVAYYFDADVEEVTIIPAEDSAGCMKHNWGEINVDEFLDRSIEDEESQIFWERYIMILLAGVVAQRRFAPETVDEELNCDYGGDYQKAIYLFDSCLGEDEELGRCYWRLLELRTKRLLDRFWDKVECIAELLLERKTLTSEEIKKAWCDAGPGPA